ncbi:hypothetical protein G210_3810 [Candida maltosa Xu316]|uniref:Uncharacterized protein n=1 Tax=Candida maltosa (strain Xu316) TaxID=1245528 RepID=M3HFD3_CANMX|nr:hypothetical protein G210_3810 [Candida maltosa Xu316]
MSQPSGATPFLNSVCPGYTTLDDNVHYQLQELPKNCREIPWPISTTSSTLKLDSSYLNVARPPLNRNESTTYVSLPYHVTDLFDKIVKNSEKGQEGYMHIGANINPLIHDPFKIIGLNPGCMTRIINLNKSKNPFADNKTLSFNKLKNKLFVKNDSLQDLHNGPFKILHSKSYGTASKLLVSTHVNVLNVFALNRNSEFMNVKKSKNSVQGDSESPTPQTERLIEDPILRIQFKEDAIITSVSTFELNDEPIIVLGFHSGELVIIKLNESKYQIFDALKTTEHSLEVGAVTTIEVIRHPNYEFLIVAGFSNGEVIILNPYGDPENNYTKTIIDKDVSATYFKKFDLSPLGKIDNSFLLGHFRVSHKPITAISSTLPINKPLQSPESQPLVLAIGSADGFVRFIDFIFTFDFNYGDKKHVIVTDILSNYFNTGITDIEFSPDFKFFCVVGKGDLIEVFKMSYYNVNGLLTKKPARRSRSGTVNSVNSGNGSTTGATTITEPRLTNSRNTKEVYPPLIKDIRVVGRFKGHTNMVKCIKFMPDKVNSSVYKLVSCGYDGKTIVWEFDYKALPKVKKLHPKPTNPPREGRSKTAHERKPHLLSPSPLRRRKPQHTRNRSLDEGANTA